MSMETFAILKDSSLAEMSTCQICGNINSNLAKVIQSVDKEKGRIKKKINSETSVDYEIYDPEQRPNVMLCAIWYRLYNLKKERSTQGGVIHLVKLQALACNFTKSITLPWVFLTFLKLYKWYQIVQSVINGFNK